MSENTLGAIDDDNCLVSSQGFFDIKIKKSKIIEWLKLVLEVSGVATIEQAIVVAKSLACTEEEKDAAHTVANLYRAQCGGALVPPISIKRLYEDLAKRKFGS